ncbi:hypothetical protein DPMN_018568 [Dreissena polymorpha]|uniref:Uncharacterized protein n=1 Tax=Dreissena polymorpha TaxID=45954 RepID=A0A9D4NGT4_DREPO|nr:hypothetical protein DPMN_018568 [Dreissena polymorpha]
MDRTLLQKLTNTLCKKPTNVVNEMLTVFHNRHATNIVLPPVSQVVQSTEAFCVLDKDIIKTNVLTKFQEDWTSNFFQLDQDVIGPLFLTKLHKDLKINVASRVLTIYILPTHNPQATL